MNKFYNRLLSIYVAFPLDNDSTCRQEVVTQCLWHLAAFPHLCSPGRGYPRLSILLSDAPRGLFESVYSFRRVFSLSILHHWYHDLYKLIIIINSYLKALFSRMKSGIFEFSSEILLDSFGYNKHHVCEEAPATYSYRSAFPFRAKSIGFSCVYNFSIVWDTKTECCLTQN